MQSTDLEELGVGRVQTVLAVIHIPVSPPIFSSVNHLSLWVFWSRKRHYLSDRTVVNQKVNECEGYLATVKCWSHYDFSKVNYRCQWGCFLT